MSEFIIMLCCAHCAVVLVSRQVVKTGLRKLLFTTNPCRCLRIIIIQSKFTTLQGCESKPKVAKMSHKKADQNNFSKYFFPIWLTSQRQTADGGGSVILSILHWLCTSLFSNRIFLEGVPNYKSSLNIICKIICFVQKLSFYCNDRLGWLDLARQAAIFEGQETLIYALLHFYAGSTAFLCCSALSYTFMLLLLLFRLIYALLHFYAASTAQCSSMLFCFTCPLLKYAATVWWGTGQDKGHWGLLSGNL